MRIAYVLPWSGHPRAGVIQKIEREVANWQRAGHETRIFLLRRAPTEAPVERNDGDRHVETWASVRERFGAARRLMSAVEAWQPSLVYARNDAPWWPSLPRLARRIPTVIEVNTDEVVEERLNRTLPRRAFNRMTRRSVLSSCSGLVFVTHELARNPRFRWYRGASIVIPNSFDLDSVRPSPASETGTRVVFMGTGESWQGVDHVLHMASLFPEWEFDVVGVSPKRAAAPGPRTSTVTDPELPWVPPNVRCHGFLSREQYTPIISSAHVALGGLGLYRKGLQEASTLKVREYLAYGLPTIIGHRDADFPNGAPFLLSIPNEPDAVDRSVDVIRRFVLEWRGRRVDRSSIAHIDTAAKEAERLAFFSGIVQSEDDDR